MYFIEVTTDKDIGEDQFVKEFLHSWYHHKNELLRPEYYGSGEPIRHSIAEKGLDAAMKMWLKNKMPVLLRRRSKPKFTVDMSGGGDNGLNPELFPNDCSVSMYFSSGDDLIIEMFKFVISFFEPAFGYITNEKDLYKKHHIVYTDSKENTHEFHIGRAPGGKALPGDVSCTFPGVYWLTYFSEWGIKQIGRERFNDLDAYSVEEFRGGYLVHAYEHSTKIQSESARITENKIAEHLGRELFFDKSQVTEEEIGNWCQY